MKVLKDDFEKPKYSFFARFLHWCFVIIFAYGIYKQVDDINQLEDISFFRTEIIFASVFLLFLIFRFFYMTKTQKTSIPEDTPKSQKFAAKIVHLSMYICLAGIAISGLLIGYFFSLGFRDELLMNIIVCRIFKSFKYCTCSKRLLVCISAISYVCCIRYISFSRN